MENKNVFIAVALSMSVLLFWSAFFETPKPTQQTQIEKTQDNNNSQKSDDNGITPQINTVIQEKEISRTESIQKNKRVNFENNKISGSISLVGGVLDDLSFKNYKKNIETKENVVFLNPKDTKDGYLIESGWASIGGKLEVPDNNSEWKLIGNSKLPPENPITPEWQNSSKLIFRKKNSDRSKLFI